MSSEESVSEREALVRTTQREIVALELELAKVRRLNQVQSEALIALKHTLVCWSSSKLFDCSDLQVAREEVESVQRLLARCARYRTALKEVSRVACSLEDGEESLVKIGVVAKKALEE